MNPTHPSSIQDKVNELANRLRLVQVDMAGQTAEERQAELDETLKRGLAPLIPEHRREVVAALMERFPSWDANVQLGATAAPARSTADAAELRDPSFLIARLLELAPGMTPGQKQAAAEELRRAGFAVVIEGGGVPEGPAAELRKTLAQNPAEPVDAGRAISAAALLAETMINIDRSMTAVWREVAPNSSVRKRETLQVTLARFTAGDKETVRSQVEAEAMLLRKISVALTNAIRPAARRFVQRHLESSGAAAVEQQERDANGRGFGFESRCWKRYQAACAAMDLDAYEREFRQVVAEEAERLVRLK